MWRFCQESQTSASKLTRDKIDYRDRFVAPIFLNLPSFQHGVDECVSVVHCESSGAMFRKHCKPIPMLVVVVVVVLRGIYSSLQKFRAQKTLFESELLVLFPLQANATSGNAVSSSSCCSFEPFPCSL